MPSLIPPGPSGDGPGPEAPAAPAPWSPPGVGAAADPPVAGAAGAAGRGADAPDGAGAVAGALAAGRTHSLRGRRCSPGRRPKVPLRGGGALPTPPPVANDQPSTVPSGGVRLPAPTPL